MEIWFGTSLFGGKSLIANMVMIFVSGLLRGARDLRGGALELLLERDGISLLHTSDMR